MGHVVVDGGVAVVAVGGYTPTGGPHGDRRVVCEVVSGDVVQVEELSNLVEHR